MNKLFLSKIFKYSFRILALKKASEQKIQATRAVVVSEFESMLKDSCHITASSRWSMVYII